MRKRTFAIALFSSCFYANLAARVRIRERIDGNIHPACAKKGVMEGKTCPCAAFYDELVEHCRMKMPHVLRESQELQEELLEPGSMLHGIANCEKMVEYLWAGDDPPTLFDQFYSANSNATSDAAHIIKRKLIGAHLHYFIFLAAGVLANTLAAFWAGFSQTSGTRQTMDHVLTNISQHTFTTGQSQLLSVWGIKKNYHIHDIEHRTHLIGQVMRKINWDRRCHNSGHDGPLWQVLSRAYAAGTTAEAKFRDGILRAEALALKKHFRRPGERHWSDYATILAWTVAGKAGADAVTALGTIPKFFDTIFFMKARGESGLAYQEHNFARQVYILFNYPQAKLESTFLFVHELPLMISFEIVTVLDFKNHCSDDLINKMASRMGKDRLSIRCYCPDCKEVADVQRNPTIARKLLMSNDYLSEEAIVAAKENEVAIVRAMKAGADVIEKLEKGVAKGIVWKAINRPSSDQKTKVDSLTECQKLCDSSRDCGHFNYHTNGDCEILSRQDELEYFHGSDMITSGSKSRKISS